ncbi:MAG: hypothetical protein Q4G58_03345 [bacterium]|nr:hypothetical protein [bacterium]
MKLIYWISSLIYYVLTGVLVYLYGIGYDGWGVVAVSFLWLFAIIWTINPIYALYQRHNKVGIWSAADVFLKVINISFIISFLDAFGRKRIIVAIGIMAVCGIINLVINVINCKAFVENNITIREVCGKNELRSEESPHYLRYYLYTMWCFQIYPSEPGSIKGVFEAGIIMLIVLVYVYCKLQIRYGNPRVVNKALIMFIGIFIIGAMLNYINALEGIKFLVFIACTLVVVHVINLLEERRGQYEANKSRNDSC